MNVPVVRPRRLSTTSSTEQETFPLVDEELVDGVVVDDEVVDNDDGIIDDAEDVAEGEDD